MDYKPRPISATSIDAYMYCIETYLWKKHTLDESDRIIAPLRWYIGTGRASVTFLHRLMDIRPYVVGRLLMQGGSYDETILRIRRKCGFPY